jgi:hypothetical protein
MLSLDDQAIQIQTCTVGGSRHHSCMASVYWFPRVLCAHLSRIEHPGQFTLVLFGSDFVLPCGGDRSAVCVGCGHGEAPDKQKVLALFSLVAGNLACLGKGFRSSVPQHIWHTVIIAFPMALGTACLLSVSSLVRRTVDVPATSPETPWKRVAATCARILAWSSVAIGSIVAVLASAILLLMASCTPPSITTLAGRFPNQRADLETIIRMSDQDPDLAVIDPGWLNSRSGQQVLGDNDPKSPLSVQRWNEYRRIFKRNDLTQGLRRFKQNGDAFIIVKSEGLLDRGYSNGYVFCGSDSEHTLPPCLSKDPRGEHTTSQGGEAYSFIKVADRWYVFSQGPG